MKELKDFATATGAEFEIYSRSIETKKVSIEDSELKDVESGMRSGVSLRLLKGGKCGFSFTGNLTDPEALVKDALASLKAGVGAEYSFPAGKMYAQLRTHSPRASASTSDDLMSEAVRVVKAMQSRAKAQVNASVSLAISEYSIFNSSGADVTWRESCVDKSVSIVSPGGSEYISGESSFELMQMPAALLDFTADLFKVDKAEIRPAAGKQNVLFMPAAVSVLLSRVRSGASGQSLQQNVTPLAGKIGDKVFSKKMTLMDDPLEDSLPGARFADDEGVPCSKFSLVEKGVFKGFYFDLNYGAKTGFASTGHGFRYSAWGADPVTLKPQPRLAHLRFDVGDRSFDELLKVMGNGIVVLGALGEHTGNIPNGDFSIGLSPGLCVENGRIVGRAKDTMLSGNIYDVLKRVVAVGSERDPYYSYNPPVLVEGVDLSN